MLNAWALLEILLGWVLVFSLVLWWARISRDVHAGRLARLVCVAALGIVIYPVAKLVLPNVVLAIIPESLWNLLHWQASYSVLMVVVVVYALGVFWRLFSLLSSHIDTFCFLRKAHTAPQPFYSALNEVAKKQRFSKSVDIQIADVAGPFTSGLFHPCIVFPERALVWSSTRISRVIAHEFAHIARRDWLWHLVIDFLLVLVWFLPGARYLKHRFTWFSELNADDAVLSLDDDRAGYANDMLAIVQSVAGVRSHQSTNRAVTLEVSIMDGSFCFERIAAILDGSRLRSESPFRRGSSTTFLMAVVFWSVLSLVSFGVAPVRSSIVMGAPKQSPLMIWESETTEEEFIFTCQENTLLESQMPKLHRPQLEELVVRHQISDDMSAEISQELFQQVSADTYANLNKVAIGPIIQVQGYIAIRTVIPEYPRKAKRKKLEGKVIAQFSVMPDGSAQDVRIAMANPKNIFDKSVIEAIQKSKFKPALKRGQPIITKYATQTFTFKLTEGATQKTYQPKLGTPIKTATYSAQ